jgi:cyclic pyranopterin phosphate synthase
MNLVADTFGRPLRSLRISVTDRCNLRCEYCMPQEDYVWLQREELLSLEEIAALADIFSSLGVSKIRLTGGEPLLRRNLEHLVRLLSQNPKITDLALTSNAVLLSEQAATLRAAGLQRLTISLDTLRPDRFRALVRRDNHARVLEGIAAARAAGFSRIKLNTVVVRGFNDDELIDMVEFGRSHDLEVRFIEYMDVGGAVRWTAEQVVSRQEMLERIAQQYGEVTPLGEQGSAPAQRFGLPDGTTFGVISSTTEPFCGTCDRARITADGMFFLCLYARQGIDLKRMLRADTPAEEIAARIATAWAGRDDRGAENRLGLTGRHTLFQIEELRSDPHREMHVRGG